MDQKASFLMEKLPSKVKHFTDYHLNYTSK